MSNESFNERLIWLLKVSRSMLATRDLDQLLTLITDAFVEVTEADRGFLLLTDRKTGILVQRVARTSEGTGITSSESRISTVANKVLKDNQPIFATDTSAEGDLALRPSVHELNLKMMVCVPLATETETLGVIYSDGTTSLDKVFTQTNRRTFEMLADHAAAAIANARMFERATNDPLTGLPNSSYFLLELAKLLQEANQDSPAGILLLDLDSFKRVNNAAGAEVGDQALIDVGTTLQEILRTDGLVARYGSDKFAILLPADGITKIGVRLRDVAERARAAIAAKAYHGIQLSACIGGISFPQEDLSSAPDAVAMADNLLSKARLRGTGEVEID